MALKAFSLYLNKIKRERLKALSNGQDIEIERNALKWFNEIERVKVIACILFSLNKLLF